MICWKSNIFNRWRKYFDIFFIMRSSMNLICSYFKILLIMTTIFNDSKSVCNVLNAKSIWLIVIKKHYIFCFRFLTSINRQKKIASIIAIFIESSEFSFENEENFDCCFLILYLLLRCFFKFLFLTNVAFVIVVISIFEWFDSMTNDSSSWSIFEWIEHLKHFESNAFDSFSTVKDKNLILRRNRMIYRELIVVMCSTLSFCDNIASRRQLDTFDRRFDLKIFKRRICIAWLNMLSWWLHLNDLKINLS